ncbi:hypothetical protein OG365_24395 [Streptomyces sp. NBC_00853]|uniref:hypothetical protein n=1 Tax=Streptomyces sp. NBC_00853 TaxID=2903681 RepID=UPI003873B07F|nr:hypothetical protein OG365_24395 [Streptomyces sp. NBC_00853]
MSLPAEVLAVPPCAPASDAADLTAAVRRLLHQEASGEVELRLGARTFELVVTARGRRSDHALALMDMWQPEGCGPVVDDPGRPFRYWLVPPGTASRWENGFGRCVAHGRVVMPPLDRDRPPGPFWVRPWDRHRLVGAGLLRSALAAGTGRSAWPPLPPLHP